MNRRQILYHIFNAIAKIVIFLSEPKDKSKDLIETSSRMDTTIDVFKWQQRNLKYKSDTEPWEEWEAPLKTFLSRRGDCEEYSLVAYYFLMGKVKSLTILCMYPKEGSGHATCLVNDKITLANWGIVHHKTSNPFHISKYFMRDCHKVKYYELKFNENCNKILERKCIKSIIKPE